MNLKEKQIVFAQLGGGSGFHTRGLNKENERCVRSPISRLGRWVFSFPLLSLSTNKHLTAGCLNDLFITNYGLIKKELDATTCVMNILLLFQLLKIQRQPENS